MPCNTLGIIQSPIPTPVFTWKKPTQSSSNPWLSLAHQKWYGPFCHTFHGLRSKMIYLSYPTQYRGNLHGHYTRPYTMPYSGPYGNCHLKKTSPTIGDQPSYHPKPMKPIKQTCPLGPKQSFLVPYPSENSIPKSNLKFTVIYNRSRLEK